LQFPLLTWKIVGGIHYEALKLWLKGMRYVPRPAPPPKASFRDEGRVRKSGGKGRDGETLAQE
jgi:DUF1365 family protein